MSVLTERKSFVKMLFLLVFVVVSTTVQGQDGACLDRYNRRGECISLRFCYQLQSVIYRRDWQRFVVHCGWEGVIPKVCCPSSSDQSNQSGGAVKDKGSPIVFPTDSPVQKTATPPNISGGGGQSSVRNKLLPAVGECGIGPTSRIVGGTATQLDEYPWLVLLKYLKNGAFTFNCGGSLINSRYVLSAAHCRGDNQHKLRSVILGEYDLRTNPDCDYDCADPVQEINVERFVAHPSYEETQSHNDIGLIRLAKPVRFSYFIKPICLPFAQELHKNYNVRERFEVSGWGKTDWGRSSPVKLKVAVKGVADIGQCTAAYSYLNPKRVIQDTQLCVGGEWKKDSCNGDSGGPLMREHKDSKGNAYWYVSGIVSYGPVECGTVGVPGVYTRVSKYLDWIQKNIEP